MDLLRDLVPTSAAHYSHGKQDVQRMNKQLLIKTPSVAIPTSRVCNILSSRTALAQHRQEMQSHRLTSRAKSFQARPHQSKHILIESASTMLVESRRTAPNLKTALLRKMSVREGRCLINDKFGRFLCDIAAF